MKTISIDSNLFQKRWREHATHSIRINIQYYLIPDLILTLWLPCFRWIDLNKFNAAGQLVMQRMRHYTFVWFCRHFSFFLSFITFFFYFVFHIQVHQLSNIRWFHLVFPLNLELFIECVFIFIGFETKSAAYSVIDRPNDRFCFVSFMNVDLFVIRQHTIHIWMAQNETDLSEIEYKINMLLWHEHGEFFLFRELSMATSLSLSFVTDKSQYNIHTHTTRSYDKEEHTIHFDFMHW